ncbi:response regulator [Actinomycetospora termitidis]|uniref:Transcriptional regulatory protein n=1 Tax=Actinomycetospora termitidis TaxID=3053470 RepID=A0ABT7M4N2_9PSEU|nr:response regulator [Actinomycetospora sp. Odt1-22]MDL5155614.1 response regulator [Actinomycetospora sp. Odt1-22]
MTRGSTSQAEGALRVLVVDDDFMVAKVHGGFVARTPGFRPVGVAHTGAEALSRAVELRPDLVLLDLYLPDRGGLDVLADLRTELPDVDVLMVTAARDAETVRAAVRGGVVHYLIKPFGFEDLRDRLLQYAAGRRALPADQEADQSAVDQLFGAGRPTPAPSAPGTRSGPRASLPKGLSAETADLVRTALRAAEEDVSASETAERVGISRVSARRYLEFFADTGRAEVRLRYGTAGRPERRYRAL